MSRLRKGALDKRVSPIVQRVPAETAATADPHPTARRDEPTVSFGDERR